MKKVKDKKLATTETQRSPRKRRTRVAGLAVEVHDLKGKVVGKIELSKEIFGAKINEKLMAQAVRVYLANQRLGTVSTKTRGEVRGSTRKLYRQKGTGRARAGSLRSPLRVGGGIIFGPKPRDFSIKLSQKMKRAALLSAISAKLKDKEVQVIDGLEKIEPKTKEMVKILKNNQLPIKEKILLVLPKDLINVKKAARNIAGVNITLANLLNTYEVLASGKLVLMKDALGVMEKTWIR